MPAEDERDPDESREHGSPEDAGTSAVAERRNPQPGLSISRQRRLVLASGSPRRFRLLSELGFDPVRDPAHVDEAAIRGESPRNYAARLAVAKARAVANRRPIDNGESPFVLGADTIVVLDDRLLEKPRDRRDAEETLLALSGREHRVMTAVALADRRRDGWMASNVVSTHVRFAELKREWVRRYVASGESMDKAGAYGIQGLAAAFIPEIRGSWSNVVGLPVHETIRMLVGACALEAFPFEEAQR